MEFFPMKWKSNQDLPRKVTIRTFPQNLKKENTNPKIIETPNE